MNKLTIPFMSRATEVLMDATVKKLLIIGQSILGYRCFMTTAKCVVKAASTTSVSRRCLYGAGATCSGTAGLMFMGSAATSVIAPNISIPLTGCGEACLYARIMIDGTADSLGMIA